MPAGKHITGDLSRSLISDCSTGRVCCFYFGLCKESDSRSPLSGRQSRTSSVTIIFNAPLGKIQVNVFSDLRIITTWNTTKGTYWQAVSPSTKLWRVLVFAVIPPATQFIFYQSVAYVTSEKCACEVYIILLIHEIYMYVPLQFSTDICGLYANENYRKIGYVQLLRNSSRIDTQVHTYLVWL